MGINQDNSFRYWQWFAENHQEEMYDVISAMINDKISQQLPQIVDEQLRQKVDNLSFNIQTTINGKSNADIKEIIKNMLIKEFQ